MGMKAKPEKKLVLVGILLVLNTKTALEKSHPGLPCWLIGKEPTC